MSGQHRQTTLSQTVKRLRLSRSANRDLDRIFHYWAKRSGMVAADRVIDSITEKLWVIATLPAANPSSRSAPECLVYPIGSYIVYYKIKRDVIAIAAIIHGSRKPKP